MTELPIREPDQIRQDCANKLGRVETSPMALAILGCLLGQDWATPRIEEMQVSPDRTILARLQDETAFQQFVGSEAELISNIQGIGKVAGLDDAEMGYMVGLVANLKKAE